MKLISILSALTLLASSALAERELLGGGSPTGANTALEQQWDVDQPTLAHDPGTGTFTVTTLHGPGMNWVHLGTYDVCPNGDAAYNGAQYQGSPFSYFSDNLDFVDNNQYSWTSVGSLGWQNDWSFQINTGELVGSSVYTEANGIGQAEFCLRYGLVDVQGSFVLVNFRQMLITITFDLQAGFVVEDFYTQAIEETTESVATEVTVYGDLCPDYENAGGFGERDGSTAKPYNQGDEICIRVCEEGQGGRVVSVDSLIAYRDDPLTNGVTHTQSIWLNNQKVGNIVADPENVASAGPNTVGYGCVDLKFLLLAIFYPVDANQVPSLATVRVEGEVTVSLLPARRQLSEGRALEETQKVELQTEFHIMESPADGSSASAMGMAGAAAMGAAALLL